MNSLSAFTLIILMACSSSCERKRDDTHSSTMPSLYRRSAFTARAEGIACYTILTGDTSSGIQYAIFGDGTHEIRDAGNDGKFTLYDYNAKEEWNIQIEPGSQVLVTPDRTTRNVDIFVKISGDRIEFTHTDDPILKSVAETFPNHKN